MAVIVISNLFVCLSVSLLDKQNATYMSASLSDSSRSNVSFPKMSGRLYPRNKSINQSVIVNNPLFRYQNMAKAERGEPQTPVPNFPSAPPSDEPMRDTRMNNQRVLMSEFDAEMAARRDRTKQREDEVKSLRFSWPPGNRLVDEVRSINHSINQSIKKWQREETGPSRGKITRWG